MKLGRVVWGLLLAGCASGDPTRDGDPTPTPVEARAASAPGDGVRMNEVDLSAYVERARCAFRPSGRQAWVSAHPRLPAAVDVEGLVVAPHDPAGESAPLRRALDQD